MSIAFRMGASNYIAADIPHPMSNLPVLKDNVIYPYIDGLLWSNSRMASNGSSEPELSATWSNPDMRYGGQQQRKIIGTTRNSDGTATLGAAVVQGFITSTDAFVNQMVSDSGGYYEFCTPFPGVQHYLVAYKAGSPDVAGTTVNTLLPT